MRGRNSVVHTDEFKQFLIEEHNNEQNKEYDSDINIRDLYPLDIHTTDKRIDDVNRFNNINDLILKHDNRISRRVTKKEIVYKKDKSRSVISIQISKRNYLKVFMLPDVEEFDLYNKFNVISKGNCKPLERLLLIKEDQDLDYLKLIIDKYIDKVLN